MHEQVEAFKEAMAHVSAPVTIITTWCDDTPHGTTVSAFSSLSVTPPMVIVSLDNRGTMVDRLRDSGTMGINVLAPDQSDLAIRFATKVPDRFDGVEWSLDLGVPRLPGITTWLYCDKLQFEPGGDHTVVLGSVARTEVLRDDALVYFRRTFGSAIHGAHPRPQ